MAEDTATQIQEQTLMNAVERIARSITAVTGRKCYIQTSATPDVNWLLQNAELPCAYIFETEPKSEVVTIGQILQKVRVAVFFVNETRAQFNTPESRAVAETEREAILQWFAEVKRRADWQTWQMIDSRDVYDGSTRLVAGYALNIEAVELYGLCAEGGGVYERTIHITKNGTYDVVNYDKAEVNVQGLWIHEDKLVLDVESEMGKIILTEK